VGLCANVGWIQNGYALERLQSSKNLITMELAKAAVRSKRRCKGWLERFIEGLWAKRFRARQKAE
jgi:hypothetical protein